MGEKDNTYETESDVWNNAKGFSTYHVLFPLIECRKLTKVCLFGVEEIGQEYGLSASVLNQNKVNAMNRLCQELLQLCEDVLFIMDSKTKLKVEACQNKLKLIANVLPAISRTNSDSRTNQTEIVLNVNHYNLCFNSLRQVLSDIKLPLNMKNLIFPAGDDLDMEKIKKDIIEGG